jgi:hypothetical protein
VPAIGQELREPAADLTCPLVAAGTLFPPPPLMRSTALAVGSDGMVNLVWTGLNQL